MPKGQKSSVKKYMENPDAYELNTGKGPTFVPRGTNKGSKDCDIYHPEHIDRSFNSPEQDYAHISEDL